MIAAILSCLLLTSSPLAAQEERPNIMPGERKPTQKKDKGPRALAVLQMASNGKASLVPVAILINNKFWDASAYKADPVPMAVESGTVYEAEQSGSSLGLFTVNNALHSNAVNTQAPWLGTGSWRPNGTEEPKAAQHVDVVPVGIDKEDKPPRLTHNPGTTAPGTPAPSSGSSQSPPSSAKPGGSNPSGSSNSDEPPRMTKPASSPSSTQSGSGSSSPPANAGGTPSASSAPAPPADSKTGDSKTKDAKAQEADVPASDSGTSEANRPRLRRGKPPESFADEEVPGYSKAGPAPTSAASDGKLVQTAATLADVKLVPAISDASGPAPHSYAFEWIRGEEDDRRKQMIQAAKQDVRTYVATLAKNKISAKPQPKTAHHASLPEPILENIQMVAYDLWGSNQPIIVFSAKAHMPAPPAGGAHSEVESETEYSITLVAYPDIYGNLRKLYSGVSDKFHLDVIPRLELVDAVDADGDGRGELLFRQTTDQGTGWVIYRAGADKLWKMFDSLSPE